MSRRNLTDFLEELGQAGELARVDTSVDPALELAQIARRIAQRQGPALLFGSVAGSEIPVAANLFATEGRIARAVGAAPSTMAARVREALQAVGTEGWLERIKGPGGEALRRYAPRIVKNAASQQVVRLGADVDLAALPFLQTTTGTARSFWAVPLYLRDDHAGRVVGCYPVEKLDSERLAILLPPHVEASDLVQTYQDGKDPLSAALVFGGDPVEYLAAAAPMPWGADRCGFAGLLRDRPLEMVSCRTHSVEVPADAEIVVEGFFERRSSQTIGPLQGTIGQVLYRRAAEVLRVTAITYRANPVLPALLPGMPPSEASALARALWTMALPLVRQAIPELVDADVPEATGHHVAVLGIHKRYAAQARRVANAAWGTQQLLAAKILIVVDADVDVHSASAVMRAIAAHLRPERDVVIQEGPADPYDPARPEEELASRMMIDATRKFAAEGGPTAVPSPEVPDEIRRRVADRWLEYGLGEF